MKTNSGQSLVAVLVAVAITGIVLTVLTGVMTNAQREAQALTEKLAALDLQKAATNALADGSVCKFLADTHPHQFNSGLTPTEGNPIRIPMGNALYTSVTGTTPGAVLTQVGQPASTLTDNLRITSMNLELTGKAGTGFTGNFVINFDNTRLVRPLKPVRVLASVTASALNSATATVASCLGANGGGAAGAGGSGELCGMFVVDSGWVTSIKMQCQGQSPTCAPSLINQYNGLCGGYLLNTICPSGYSPLQLASYVTATSTSGSPGYAGQPGSQGSTPDVLSSLYSCTPN